MAQSVLSSKAELAINYSHQAEKLSLDSTNDEESETSSGSTAVQANFITPLDPVIETADGNRLPAVPPDEAAKLNELKNNMEGHNSIRRRLSRESTESRLGAEDAEPHVPDKSDVKWREELSHNGYSAKLASAVPPSRTHPLFPPLPLYGPPSVLRNLQCKALRLSSCILSLAFLGVIVLGSAFTSIPLMFNHIGLRLTFRDPAARRPFHQEEERRKRTRLQTEREWTRQRKRRRSRSEEGNQELGSLQDDYQPTEGGPDRLICDVAYYARRVGLDVEEFKVQTEDGFIIALWHVYNPVEYVPCGAEAREHQSPNVFVDEGGKAHTYLRKQYTDGSRRYPVLLMHGLLQSAGAYCTNDDDSLAFFLCKAGYDVWLGNNRCGFEPRHTTLDYYDPRMWAWNIRQMGVLDLPALISRVLLETGFEKLGLVCHSQGTTETFVALAKEQRPDLGKKISVFCALAPAVYAGPLIGKMYFKFMRVISPSMFRIFFGIHAFIPFMMTMHRMLPGTLYGAMGYRVFSFLFNWTDDRWERDLRDRMFQFAPVYVSAESMRWWLGRECFARQKCILATREEGQAEDAEDEEQEKEREENERAAGHGDIKHIERLSWYNEQAPPFAFWIAGSDDLVDGRRLLRRFERGREPHVQLVHSKVIEEYEHLDVIWAMDSIEKVGKEVRDVIWKTAPDDARSICRVPRGSEEEAEPSRVTGTD
jgi:pimeloyl-ACP methyl ester carboxylesterase